MSLEKIFKSTGIFITAYYDEKLFLTIKDDSGVKKDFYFNFSPYFYLVSKSELLKEDFTDLKKLKGILEIIKTEKENLSNVYKIIFKDIDSLMSSKEHLLKKDLIFSFDYKIKEHDIPFIQRFFIDYSLSCFKKINYSFKENEILSFEVIDDVLPETLNHLTFDIEVLPLKDLSFPEPKTSPIISICVMDQNHSKSIFFLKDLSYDEKDFFKDFNDNKTNVFFFTDESLLIESFFNFLEEKDPDLIFTYNGDKFDFNYIYKRYKVIKSKEVDCFKKITFHKRGNTSVSIKNIIHIDTYVLMRLLNYLQIFNYPKLDLNTVYSNITGNKKIILKIKDFITFYNSRDYKKIIEYNIDDVSATYYLSINYLSIVNEISKLICAPIYDVLRTSAGQMIEKLFIYNYFKKNKLIEDKPNQNTISKRYQFSFTGAFVKDPIVGLHENIAIVDFRSYHISIIMAYNISPESINVSSNNFYKVLNYKISKDKKGFVPELLENFLNLRISIKDEMNKHKKDTQKYKTLYAKQYALKILLASTYGYMGFSGARWYCRPCLEIMYHLVRTKIQETISMFESLNYTVIYSDTDSCFIKFKDLQDLKKDVEKINQSLPKSMSLETEGLFKSGLFVMSRDKTKGAKKKYALLAEDDSLKIKGFEFVRRDWCPLVKETQKELFLILLKEKDVKKAVDFLRDVVFNLENRKIPLKKLILQGFIHKKTSNYKTKNPALSALLHAKKEGKNIKDKDLIEYIITNYSSKNISDKARIYLEDDSLEYDINYYLENQLLPAIVPILNVFNISKDELLTGKKQKGLNDFF
jgi:DNA polymerase, archaea type